MQLHFFLNFLISLPSTLENIKFTAFSEVPNLMNIYYNGTGEQWRNVDTDHRVYDSTVTCADGTVFPSQKKANTLRVTGKTAKLKYRKLKRKARTVSRSKILKISQPQGSLSYRIVSVSKSKYRKYFKINASTGKVTVKKKLKKGKYKIKCAVTASGNNSYWIATKTVTFKIKVK